MNDEPLSRDHGYPFRVVVTCYADVRNVKWLSKLELGEEQAEGSCQRGLFVLLLLLSLFYFETISILPCVCLLFYHTHLSINIMNPYEEEEILSE